VLPILIYHDAPHLTTVNLLEHKLGASLMRVESLGRRNQRHTQLILNLDIKLLSFKADRHHETVIDRIGADISIKIRWRLRHT